MFLFKAKFGFGKKFGKVDELKTIFATGHNKEFGKVVTYAKSQGFKFGKVTKFGSFGGATKGFGAKHGFAKSGLSTGFKKGGKFGKTGFSSGGLAAGGYQNGQFGKAGHFTKAGDAAHALALKNLGITYY